MLSYCAESAAAAIKSNVRIAKVEKKPLTIAEKKVELPHLQNLIITCKSNDATIRCFNFIIALGKEHVFSLLHAISKSHCCRYQGLPFFSFFF